MRASGVALALAALVAVAPDVAAQAAGGPDSAGAEIRSVLRAFYLNLANENWDALAAYVLSPKLLERRGGPGDAAMVARDRTRRRAPPADATAPRSCSSGASPMIADAALRIDGDWADVWVPRCSGGGSGVDQFGMLYFEGRWRFIYTDLFPEPRPATAVR